MADQILTSTTEAGRMMGTRSHNENEPVIGVDGMTTGKERLPGGTDYASLTDADRQTYGIRPDEVHAWVRNPQVYRDSGHGNRLHEVRREHPGARVIMENGFPVTNGADLALVAIPRAEMEAVEARAEQEQRDLEKKMETQDWEDSFDPSDKAEVRARMQASREAIRRSGMAGPGSPTAGKTLAQVLATTSRAQIELDASRAQRGERHITHEESDREATLRAEVERYRSRSRNRTYFIPK